MLYALVLASLMSDLGIDRATGGLLGSLTLAASAVGGIIFGVVADRWGRTRALSLSILIYSVFTALCGVAQNVDAARGLPAVARHRHGRRVGQRRGAGLRDLAGEASRQGARPDAILLGHRLRRRRHRRRARPAALRMARRVLRRHHPGALHAVDPPERRGTGNVAAQRAGVQVRAARHSPCTSCTRCTSAPVAPARTRTDARPLVRDRRPDADERRDDVRVVGAESVDPGLPVVADDSGRHRPHDGGMSCFVVAMQVGMWFGYVTFGVVSDRFGRKPTYVHLPHRGRDPRLRLRRRPDARWRCLRSVRSSRFSAPATSAVSAPSPRRSIRRRSAPRRRASPTTSAGSPAPRRRSSSASLAQERGFGAGVRDDRCRVSRRRAVLGRSFRRPGPAAGLNW